MSRKKPNRRHTSSRPTLPPFPWETTVTHRGKKHPTARPDLVTADVVTGTERDGQGDVQPVTARVWRTPLPPACATLPPAARAALIHYAEVSEAVVASGGTSDPTGGVSRTPPTGPSLARLAAAEALGAMRIALASGAVSLRRPGRRARPVTIAWVDLIEAAAVNGQDCTAMARAALGTRKPSPRQVLHVTAALRSAAMTLADHCGFASNTERHATARGL